MNKKLEIEEVRKTFTQLISQLEQNGGYVEIVKNKHTVAVIVNFEEFRKLQLRTGTRLIEKKPKTKWKLAGSMELADDFEESASEPPKLILNSISKSKL